MAESDQDWTESCPICFVEHASLARSGNCGHAFCIECLEQFFKLRPQPTSRQEETISTSSTTTTTTTPDEIAYSVLNIQALREFSIDGIETLRRCPLCRSPISLMDMQDGATGQPVMQAGRQLDIRETSLAGKAYATRRGVGYNSFHFPPFANESEDVGNQSSFPYLLWQEDDVLYPLESSNAPAQREHAKPSTQTKYYFDPGCFYFGPKRIFQGRVSLPDAHGRLQRHDVLLSFANNHKWITGGFMLRNVANRNSSDINTNPEGNQQQYPLEGKWKVTWYRERLPADIDTSLEDDNAHSSLIINTDHVNVTGNTIQDLSPVRYMLQYEQDRIFFRWPGFGVTQTLNPECDFRKATPDDVANSVKIPAVGDCLKWTTTYPDQPFIVWQRESMGDPISTIPASIQYFGRSGGESLNRPNADPAFARMRNDQTWYREWHPSEGANDGLLGSRHAPGRDGRPPYYMDQLWGNTFCQGLRMGMASYHFRMPTATTSANTNGEESTASDEQLQQPLAYISYEHAACLQWPPLDDGSPIPPQVYFHNISIEQVEETRPNPDNAGGIITSTHIVFRGNIEWLQDYGTTWQNNERWEYEMHFDAEMTCILSGIVHAISPSSSPSTPSSREEMSHFGTDLIYLNAGILNAFESGIGEEPDVTTAAEEGEQIAGVDSTRYERYLQQSRRLRRRLQTEGASVRTVAMMNHVLTLSQQPGNEPPIDYNL